MRTLIFSTAHEAGTIRSVIGGQIFTSHTPLNAAMPKEESALFKHIEKEDSISILVGDSMIMGWSTLHPCQIIFSKSYPNDERIRTQARSRVRLNQ